MKKHIDNIRELAGRLQRYDIPTADEAYRYVESLQSVGSITHVVQAMLDDAAMATGEAQADRRAFYEGRLSGLSSVVQMIEGGAR